MEAATPLTQALDSAHEEARRYQGHAIGEDVKETLNLALPAHAFDGVRLQPTHDDSWLSFVLQLLGRPLPSWSRFSDLPSIGAGNLRVVGDRVILAPDVQVGTITLDQLVRALVVVELQAQIGFSGFSNAFVNARPAVDGFVEERTDRVCEVVDCFVDDALVR